MKAKFTIRERVYNGGGLKGSQLYIKDDTGQLELKVVDHVKDIFNMPLFQIHFVDGTVMNVKETEPLLWEVTSKKNFKTGFVPRLKGKEVWGNLNLED
jgi:hypothetical protein